MLKYFVDNCPNEFRKILFQLINEIKSKLKVGDYESCKADFQFPDDALGQITQIAKENNNEQLANSAFVFKAYYSLWISLAHYFLLLDNRQFRASWDKLQDCFDILRLIGRHAQERYDLDDIRTLLESYEQLYPFKVFLSSEYVITKSHCSICGKSMQSLSCPHRKGELYWGEQALEVIDDIKTLQAICVVKHPEDKRCIIENVDDMRSEDEKYALLVQFLSKGFPKLMQFQVDESIEERKRFPNAYPNDLCPCGSGVKYKYCCKKKPNIQHKVYRVIYKNEITLKYFDLG